MQLNRRHIKHQHTSSSPFPFLESKELNNLDSNNYADTLLVSNNKRHVFDSFITNSIVKKNAVKDSLNTSENLNIEHEKVKLYDKNKIYFEKKNMIKENNKKWKNKTIIFLRLMLRYLLSFYNLKNLLKQMFIKFRNKFAINKMIEIRVLILTIYFILNFILLTVGVWDSDVFALPPASPSIVELIDGNKINKYKLDFLNKFLLLVHPHVDGNPNINLPLDIMMRNSLGFTLGTWVALLWLISSSTETKKKKKIFGIITGISLFWNITGTWFGGLSHKTVLYPDIWNFIFQRINTNILNIKSTDVLQQSSLNPNFLLNEWRNLLFLSISFPLNSNKYNLENLIIPLFYIMYILDYIGLLLHIFDALRFCSKRQFSLFLTSLSILLSIGHIFLSRIPKGDAGDKHWIDFSHNLEKDFNLPKKTEPPSIITTYVPMSDGIKLAVDVYLPSNVLSKAISMIPNKKYKDFYNKSFSLKNIILEEIPKIPTFIMITRYNRRMTVKWPFSMLSLWGQPVGSSTTNIWSWQFIDALIANNYALVIIDTRGTGASFGTRPVDLSPDELNDFETINKWVTDQFWFNGKIATGGYSYDGITGLSLASRSKNVQAVLALFTPVDVVRDLIQPGGIVCSSFVEDYTGLTMAFEKSGTPRSYMLRDFGYDWQLTLGFLLTFGTAAPVRSREWDLYKAIKEHSVNWNMSYMVQATQFSDDFVLIPGTMDKNNGEPQKIPVSTFGITETVLTKIANLNISVYIVGGYCDSSGVRGSARLFESLQNKSIKKNNSLIIGPWTHTGRRNCSPYSHGTFSNFEQEMYWDVIRFLDLHLKNKTWTITSDLTENSTPVHYWVIGEERWYGSNEFPPINLKQKDFIFTGEPAEMNKLKELKKYIKEKNQNKIENLIENINNTITDIFESNILINFKQQIKIFFFKISLYIKHISLFYNLTKILYFDLYNILIFNKDIIKSNNINYDENYIYNMIDSNDTLKKNNNNRKKYITFPVDYNATTKGLSRWVIAKHPFRMAVKSFREIIPNRLSKEKINIINLLFCKFFNFPFWSSTSGTKTGRQLIFTTKPIKKEFKIIGSPIIRFTLNLTEELERRSSDIKKNFFSNNNILRINELMPIPAFDITIFGYLEDLDISTGEVHYITEGRILLSHRYTLSKESLNITGLLNWKDCIVPPYEDNIENKLFKLKQKGRIGSADVVYQSGDRKTHRFSIGGEECIVFTFEPIAWYMRPGHLLRLSLAGADRANFQWSRTQSKEDTLLSDTTLLAAALDGIEKLTEVRRRGLHVQQPEIWDIPLYNKNHLAFLKLPIHE